MQNRWPRVVCLHIHQKIVFFLQNKMIHYYHCCHIIVIAISTIITVTIHLTTTQIVGDVSVQTSAKKRTRRSTAPVVNYNEDTIPTLEGFLDSDSSGSDTEESGEGDEYNTSVTPARFDSLRGCDDWLGRRVCKVFEGHGDFEGIIYAVDDDENKPGYRLFSVYYFEDPDDQESMWPEEVVRLMILFVLCVCFVRCIYVFTLYI